MFRFSIRDLLWLTLVVAMSLGWWTDRQRLRAQGRADLDRARQQARQWHMAAEAFGVTLRDDGWKIIWDLNSSKLTMFWPDADTRRQGGSRTFTIDPFDDSYYELVDSN